MNEQTALRHQFKITSSQIIPAGFFALILSGALLLMIPAATSAGEKTSFLTALFTSTTSVCVTGLVVVDTFSHWTILGQIIILVLIQLGGLGIISVTSAVMLALHKKISLKDRLLIHDAFNLNDMQGLVRFLYKVFKGTFLVEGIGACFYLIVFVPEFGVAKGIWISVFNSVSAFCNAGIDIIGPNSLMNYNSNPLVLIVTILLIVLGGLGYVVWFDLCSTVKKMFKNHYNPLTFYRRLNEHSKLVINVTLFLIFSGGLLTLITEYGNVDTIGKLSLGDKILNSIFQSVTYRTAGFASISQKDLHESTAVIGCLYMFIGGSPVGTAGGVKTITMLVVVLNVVSFIKNRDETVIFNRKITKDMIQKANAIVTFNFTIIFVLMLLLMTLNHANAVDSAYEICSATSTVGLSRGLTPNLTSVGRIIVITAMYLGRIGPISMALFFNTSSGNGKNDIKYAEGRFIIG